MSSNLRVKEEYEIQHFGFSLEQFQLECRILIKKRLQKIIDKLIETILLKNKNNIDKETIRNAACATFNNTSERIKEELYEIDCVIKKHFFIPKNVLLPENTAHSKVVNEEETHLKAYCNELEEEYFQNKFMLHQLNEELALYQDMEEIIAMIDHLKSYIEISDCIDDCTNQENNLSTFHV